MAKRIDDALAVAGPNHRGHANAVVFVERDNVYIDELHAAGVQAARFSFRRELGVVRGPAQFGRAGARIRELGWHVKIQPEKDSIVGSVEYYESLGVPVPIDHMARRAPETGADDPNLRKMAKLPSTGNFWVMLSLTQKTSKAGPPWDDVIPIVRTYLDTAPGRFAPAIDRPHSMPVMQPPNDAVRAKTLEN